MEQQKSYNILALILGAGGAIIAISIIGLYALYPASLTNTSATNLMAGLGALATLYYISLHQLLKRRYLAWSTLWLVALSILNLILLIAQTGGLNSPFYSLWLLVIVISGLFGGIYTGITLGCTVLFYLYVFINSRADNSFSSDLIAQFLITLAAAGIAEWIYRRSRISNITQMHAASLSGQLSQEHLKAEMLMGSMADGVIVVDSTLRLQLINPAAENLTGWDQASAHNVHYRSILHLKSPSDQDIDDTNDPFIEALTSGKPLIKNNLSILTRAGRKIELSLSISPLNAGNNQISGAMAVFRDITGEKAMERQRGEFISTASHEMRTPVAAIEGYISLAMNPKVATIDDRAHSFLEKAHDSVQHLGALFRDLLSITKLEEGKVGKKLEIVDLAKLLKDIVADMQFSVTKKGLSLTYSPTSINTTKAISPYYPVLAEPERLREVVMNLIENAAKFTSQGGITVRIFGDADSVTVGVVDTGIGIAAEDIPHLFQKFYRIDNSATRTIGGTGLGLYLCRGLIELYNGRLWVESVPGQGSTFKFSLPIAKSTANLPATSVSNASATTTPTTQAASAPSSVLTTAQSSSATPASSNTPATPSPAALNSAIPTPAPLTNPTPNSETAIPPAPASSSNPSSAYPAVQPSVDSLSAASTPPPIPASGGIN